MITNISIAAMYARNIALMTEYTNGMTHAQSLLAPHPRANCAHWLVGHLCVYRNRLLHMIGAPPAIDDAAVKRYMRDTPPVLNDEPGLTNFEVLRAALLASQQPLADGFIALAHDGASVSFTWGIAPNALTMSTSDWFVYLLRHEAYHTGQLELCAELVR